MEISPVVLIVVVAIIIIFIVGYKYLTCEGFEDPATQVKINDVKKNRELFMNDGSYNILREKITWLDPISHYDVKKLAVNGELSDANLKTILNSS